jgi:hypothetical protein
VPRAPSHSQSGFTGGVSDSPAPEASAAAAPPAPPEPAALEPAAFAPAPPPPELWPPARRPWTPWADARADLKVALALLGGIALAGVPVGLLWWWLAPRAEFHITADGPIADGVPSPELLVADDGVLALLLAALGLLVGILGWRLRHRRGLAVLLALAFGSALAGVVAWRLGVLLAPPPSRAEVSHVGGTVTTGLSLGALPVLAVAPFVAVLAYLVPAAYSASDDLGRTDTKAAPRLPEAEPASFS